MDQRTAAFDVCLEDAGGLVLLNLAAQRAAVQACEDLTESE